MVTRAELKTRAKAQLKSNLWLCIGVILVFTILTGLTGTISAKYPGANWTIALDLYTLLFGGVFLVGVSKFLLNIVNNENPQFTDLFSAFKIYFKTLGLYILIGLAVVIGTILFIIPGIIIGLGISMAPYIMAEDNSKGVIESLKESWAIMKGHKWEYFILELSFILWMLLGIITFGIAYLWIVPYMYLTETDYYLELKKDYINKEII